MRYTVEDTAKKHEKILEHGGQLLRERGLSKVSVAEIMKAAGLTHGAFYSHFDSKEDMVAKIVEHVSGAACFEIAEAERTPRGLGAYVESYLSSQHRDGPGAGCLIAAIGAELGREPTIRPALTEHVKATLRALIRPLRSKRIRDARAEAICLLSAMVGAIVLARAVDDEALSDEILNETRKAWADEVH